MAIRKPKKKPVAQKKKRKTKAAYMNINLHNDMGHPQWFTVTDNVAGQNVLDGNMDTDGTKSVSVAVGEDEHGDITYVPKGYVGTHAGDLNDGDTVNMSG